MIKPKDYDATVARIAGNIASGILPGLLDRHAAALWQQPTFDAGPIIELVRDVAVTTARAIVAEVKRTEPKESES